MFRGRDCHLRLIKSHSRHRTSKDKIYVVFSCHLLNKTFAVTFNLLFSLTFALCLFLSVIICTRGTLRHVSMAGRVPVNCQSISSLLCYRHFRFELCCFNSRRSTGCLYKHLIKLICNNALLGLRNDFNRFSAE